MMSQRWLTIVTFFTSTSTLLCCALPALLVSIGLGATLAGVLSAVPQLIWVSENKATVFIVSGILLAFGGLAQWRARTAPCPMDPELRRLCMTSRAWSRWIYLISLALYLVGFFFAYLIAFFLEP